LGSDFPFANCFLLRRFRNRWRLLRALLNWAAPNWAAIFRSQIAFGCGAFRIVGALHPNWAAIFRSQIAAVLSESLALVAARHVQ
jgi:hypothetical protein